MKKNLSIIAFLSVALSARAQTFTIKAPADSAIQGKKAYLRVFSADNRVSIADSLVVSSPEISFTHAVDGVQQAGISVDRNHQAGAFVEPGVITCDLATNKCQGTPLNDAKYKAVSAIEEQQERYYPLARKIYGDSTLTKKQKDEMIAPDRAKFHTATDSIYSASIRANDNLAGAALVIDWIVEYVFSRPDMAASGLKLIEEASGDFIKASNGYASSIASLRNLASSAIGSKLADCQFPTGSPDSTPVSIYDYVGKDKYVLLDFWASWCGPCREEMPNVVEAYKKYGGKSFEIVGIAVYDSRQKTLDAMEKLGITWPVIFGATWDDASKYGVIGIPSTILVDPSGTIIDRNLRGDSLQEKLFEIFDR